MTKMWAVVRNVLPMMAVVAGLFLLMQPAMAQSASPHNDPAAQQQPPQPGDGQAAPSETKTFTGKIVKTGDKFVLSDVASKTTYELDDQMKAQSFLNKTVKVTGVLDAATGVIHVSVIEPA